MDDRLDRSAANEGDELDDKPAPAADEQNANRRSEPAPKDDTKDETDEEKRDSRLAQSHREAEIIAQNLRESGTRR